MNLSVMHTVNGSEYELNIVKRVSIVKMEAIIEFVAANVFQDGVYKPARFDYYFWLGVIAAFTDFDVSNFSQDELYDLFDDNRFTEKLRGVISPVQLERIEKSAKELVDLKLNEHPLKAVCEKAVGILNNVHENINTLFKDENWANEVRELFSQENIALLLQYFGTK